MERPAKVALITGASRGIGAASAKALAHHGATVVINYIQSKDKAEGLLDEVKKGGGKLPFDPMEILEHDLPWTPSYM